MKRVLAVVMTIIMLLSSVFILASCSNGEGKTINAYYVSSLYDFDPSLAFTDDEALDIFNLVYEPLFILKDNGKVKGGLADDYSIDEDENSMTITLSDTFWSDGQPLTNEDVAFAWKRILDPNIRNNAAAMLYEIKNALDIKRGEDKDGNTVTVDDLGVELDGTKIIKIYFENENVDYDGFLRNLTSVALTPLREDVVSQREDYWSKRKATVVTNGAFTFGYIDYATGTFTVTRNKYYNRDPESSSAIDKYVRPYAVQTAWHDGKVDSKYEGLYWSSSQFGSASLTSAEYFMQYSKLWLDKALEQFENDTLFYVGDLSLEARKNYKDSKLLTLTDSMSTYTYVMNCNKFPKEVRVALSSVIDREHIVNEITTFGRPATAFVSYGLFNGTKKKYDFRKEGGDIISTKVTDEQKSSARDAINAAQSAGTFDKYETYTIKCKNNEEDIAVARYVAQQWIDLGLDIRIQILTYTVGKADEGMVDEKGNIQYVEYNEDDVKNAYVSGNYDILAIDYNMLSTDAFTVLAGFTSDMNGNGCDFSLDPTTKLSKNEIKHHSSGYTDAAYDEILNRAYAEKDLNERAIILHEAEKKLMEDMPIIPLYFNQNFYLQHKELKSIDVNYYGLPIFTDANLKVDVEKTNKE
ncbi:MAG: ABC transporter substrate-binding protein [Eubacteriales bacterium]|nr:ABC transporter substrate-binding protein [Eubacteriales bacterium]